MKIINWLMVAVGILLLIGVRAVEDRIFYDPFLEFFHQANKEAEFPSFEWFPLILNYVFRFLLNVVFSLIVIHFMFRNKTWTLQAAALMTIVFLIALPVYLYCISTEFEIGYLFSFYTRRFVIQPLTLLLIVPIFYYRKSLISKDPD